LLVGLADLCILANFTLNIYNKDMFEGYGKAIFSILISVVLIVIIANNVKTALNYQKGVEKVEYTEQKLLKLQAENQELKDKIQETENPEYIEKLAIEELNLASQDATILIIPEENELLPEENPKAHSSEKMAPNYEKWLLFLGL
jgi:cell division protein FtsB